MAAAASRRRKVASRAMAACAATVLALTSPGAASLDARGQERPRASSRTDQAAPDKAARLAEAFGARLQAIADGVDGVVGYLVLDVTTGQTFGRSADEPFPTASAIKVGILYELLRQADEGRVALDERRPLDAAAKAGGSGVLQHLSAPALSPRDHAVLMMLLSDNTSTNVLIDLLGMDAINARMAALGARTLSLERRMMDAAAVASGRENLASASDLVKVMDALRQGTGLSPASRDEARRILTLPASTALRRGVPSGVTVAAKPGGLPGVRTEVGWVEAEGRPYVLAVMTTFLAQEAEGDRAITEISRAAYQYFARLGAAAREGRLR